MSDATSVECWRSSGPSRVLVVGDIGGFPRPFFEFLKRLGVRDGRLPDGYTVIQLGDLIGGMAPGSERVVDYTDRLIANSEGRWVQLIGNWEANYLSYGQKFGSVKQMSDMDDAHSDLMASWFHDERGSIAAVVRLVDGTPLLVTHAGVTAKLWSLLGEPDIFETARLLNWLGRRGESVIYQAGAMMGRQGDTSPGPLWADPRELWGSWLEWGEWLPFNQVVGHTSPWDWRRGGWSSYQADNPHTEFAKPIHSMRQTRFTHPMSGRAIQHVDNQLWSRSDPDELRPLHLEHAEVIVPG